MNNDTATDPSGAINPSMVQKISNGLWHNNPALVQLLGLCPLLAVSNSATNGLALGLATAATIVVSNTCVSATRRYLLAEIRIPVYVILIAGIVTIIGLLMNAWLHELYLALGIFIPLIITNCAIIARAESFASRQPVLPSIIDGIVMGAGFACVLVVLGGVRELLGSATLFSDAHLLFGPGASHWAVDISEHYHGLLIAVLPPGAFILLGMLIAVKNATDRHTMQRIPDKAHEAEGAVPSTAPQPEFSTRESR